MIIVTLLLLILLLFFVACIVSTAVSIWGMTNNPLYAEGIEELTKTQKHLTMVFWISITCLTTKSLMWSIQFWIF